MARKKFFLPKGDSDLVIWLQNFSSKINGYASRYGIKNEEVEKVQQGAAFLIYWIGMAAQIKRVSKQFTDYKNEVRDGLAAGGSASLPPTGIVCSPPVNAGPGVMPFILSIVARIKSHRIYTESDGKNLGVEGTEQQIDLQNLKPEFKIELVSGHPNIVWLKGISHGVKIKVMRNYNPLAPAPAEGFQFLTLDTQPDYLDKFPLPPYGQSACWAYVLIYVISDEEVGQWTAPKFVTVTGTP
jgi:hypothetical protein